MKMPVGTDRVNPSDPYGIAGAGDGGEIMGFVHAVHDHRQIRLTTVQHLHDALISCVSHHYLLHLVTSSSRLIDRNIYLADNTALTEA